MFCVCYCFAFRSFADMWSSEHQQYFDAIDTTCGSKLLVTTRIKNLLSSRGVEVELELLGLQGTSSMCLQRTCIYQPCVFDTRSVCRVCRAASRRSRVGRRSGAADVSRDCSAVRASPPLFEHRWAVRGPREKGCSLSDSDMT